MTGACIIEVAVNGATTKDVNPRVPRTPPEIVADALACIDAGATIVHNHNDEFLWAGGGIHAAGPYLAAWWPILDVHPDILLYGRCPAAGLASRSKTAGVCADLSLAPSISIFDPSILRVALAFHDAGGLSRGTLIKLYFGGSIPFGLPPTTASLEAYLAMMEGRDPG